MKKLSRLLVILSFTISYLPFSSFSQNSTEFWGMTNEGGSGGGGTIFKTDGNGNNQQVIRSFSQTSGQNPYYTQLCEAANGKLYGMTYQGGMNSYGVLFEFDPATSIYVKKLDFDGTNNGSYPYGSLVKASNGKLYGMTSRGGANGVGVLFEYDPTTNTYTKKLDFAAATNGGYPYGSLIQAPNGKLYGMTYYGGANNMGVLFEYNITLSTYTKKLDFAGTTTGSYPYGTLMQATGGKLYGLTYQGGVNGYGVLFEYKIPTNTLTKKFDFTGTATGSYPLSSVIQLPNGKLYGMTYYGGANGYGVLFEYDTATSTYTKKLDFAGTSNGRTPYGSLFRASNGKLYGMTSSGGVSSNGVLFEYDAATSSYTKKLDFAGATNGSLPYGTVMQASNGKLYGMTSSGGAGGQGVIFEYDPATSTYTKKLDFLSGNSNGGSPQGSLLKASNGKLYGMTSKGGSSNYGVLFELDPTSGTYTKKMDFTGTATGSSPYGSLVQASNGKLYGMTYQGGASGNGVLFEYNPSTSTYTKKLDFAGSTNGSLPYGSLILARNGKLYGMTYQGGTNNLGVLFEYDPATSTYTKKQNFAGTTNGSYPRGSLIQASNGKLYGMTYYGGANSYGVLFEYNPITNTLTKKIDFSYTANGCYPYGSLTQATNGKLYGMTYYGGASGNGVLFSYDTATSSITKELDFAGTTNGGYPYGSVMQAANGKLYGMTYQGGSNNFGVLFEYNPITTSFTKKLDFDGANGKNPYYTQLIEVCEQPRFTAIIPDATICPGSNTNFITKATGNSLTYQWQVDAGKGFSDLTNNSIYADVTDDTLHITGGTSGMNGYQYRCVVTSTCPAISVQSDTALLTINPKPVSSFTINDNSQCLGGNNFVFTNTSIWASTYLWNFGDGNTSSTISPSHSYISIGSYTVKLVSMFGYSCKDSITKIVDVRIPPVSSFTINNNSQCLGGNNFVFTNTSAGGSKFIWNFGDGDTSGKKSPTHSYTSSGAYTVKLISMENYSCRDSSTKTLDVRPQPVSSFTINNSSPCLSSNFVFINTTTGASTYLWNFGDATTSGITSPSHSYTAVGAFVVKLVSTTTYGCQDSTIKTIDVRPQPVSSFTINNNSQCLGGNNFVFTNTATGASAYLWNFGDANTSNTTSPSHSYTTVGAFIVKLVSITSYGCKDSTTKAVNVRPKPVPSFIVNNNNQCLSGNNFVFTNTSTGGSTYFWNFGDAATSGSTSPSHSYTTEGTFTVKLVSIESYSCKDSTTKTVDVRPKPVSSFTINNSSQCLKGNNFAFSNTTIGASTYLWSFGDNLTSITTSPSHTYAKAGSFTVKLESKNSYGCIDSTTSAVLVRAPVVNLGKDTTIYGTAILTLNAGSGFDSYLWLGYYTTSTMTVSAAKSGYGVKTIYVRVTQNGCEGYDTIVVTIKLKNSIIESQAGFDIKVYPNPVNSLVNISLSPITKEMVITLTDMYGKQLKSIMIMPDIMPSNHQIDISEFAEGVYYLDISNAEIRKVVKIVKY